MTIMLLANVGNRDVGVTREIPIPGEVNPLWNDKASRRAMGRAILENWEACRPHLSLPIIGKAVDYILDREGTIDRIILIASDQSGVPDVSDYHLAQDTIELAHVVSRYLTATCGLPEETITTWTIERNPADYGGMQTFFRARLRALKEEEQAPGLRAYLEVSGGTPAMTSMLLTVGAEVFGLDAYPLYVSQYEETPFQLDLGRRVVAESLQDVIRENTRLYAYHAAARTLASNLELLDAFCPAEAIHAVCAYAHQRLNFNFEEAQSALTPALEGARHEDLGTLALSEAEHYGRTEWLLHEILFNAEIRLRIGAYGDFLVRVFRFDEAILRYMARRLGARLVDRKGEPDEHGEFLDPDWLNGKPGLQDYFDTKHVRRGDEGRISANRFVLNLTVVYLARQQDDQAADQARKKLGKLQRLSSVRNESFAVHTFDGVSSQRIAAAFTGRGDAESGETQLVKIVNRMREVCELATGQPVAEINPYDRINARILDLLDA